MKVNGIIFSAIVFVIILLFGIFLFGQSYTKDENTHRPQPTVTMLVEKTILQSVSDAFSKKYNTSSDAFIITVDKQVGDFAKGSVRSKNEMSGGLWFAAKRNGVWQLVFDGNGIIQCSSLKEYPDFPTTLIPQCFDTEKNELVKR